MCVIEVVIIPGLHVEGSLEFSSKEMETIYNFAQAAKNCPQMLYYFVRAAHTKVPQI